MKHKNLSKPMPKVTSTTIDADVLARINDKVAKAHRENERLNDYKKPKIVAGALTTPYSIIDR